MRTSQLLRLSAIHVAVALTLLPINSTLNRIMISELGIPASLVALLIAVPYIMLGLVLCAGGSALTPQAAYAIYDGVWWGIPLGFVAFGAWGFGFNFATVSYLSLATELSGTGQRARTVGVMWFVLILSMIIGGISLARSIEPYSHARLAQAFEVIAGLALTIGLLGLLGLEPRYQTTPHEQRISMGATLRMVGQNSQARYFFVYLMLLLIALLGQDVLLEPYAADIFGVSPANTTRYTSIWGVALLVGLLVTNRLTQRYGLKRAAQVGAAFAALGLLGIVLAGLLHQVGVLVPSLVLFGFGAGISTAANLALMLDMTIAGQVGLFIGAWGVADALARLGGTLLSGVVRDVVTYGAGNKLAGYTVVFAIELVVLLVSMAMLQRIQSDEFQSQAIEIVEVAAHLS